MDKLSSTQKAAIYVGLFLIWGIFAALGLTPVQGFIDTVKDAIIAFGVVHATLTDPKI